MKINRIIFISYFSLTGLFLLGLMAMGFVYKDAAPKWVKADDHFEIVRDELAPFSHLYVENNCHLILSGSDQLHLSYTIDNQKEIITPVYEVRNDTLFLKSTSNNLNNWVTINTNCPLQSIHGENCHVRLRSLKQPSLHIDFAHTNLRIEQGVKISSLDLSLKENSDFNGWDLEVSELKMNLLNSKFQGRSRQKLDWLKGTISNQSDVHLPKAKHIQLEVDETSEIKMY